LIADQLNFNGGSGGVIQFNHELAMILLIEAMSTMRLPLLGQSSFAHQSASASWRVFASLIGSPFSLEWILRGWQYELCKP
jgi:hypothetical protein